MKQFNWQQYIANYPDLVSVGINNKQLALRHFRLHGMNEGRTDKNINKNINKFIHNENIIFVTAFKDIGREIWKNFERTEIEITPLCTIMEKNKSDKGGINNWHNYTTIYYNIFKDIKDIPLRIFELGIGTNNINMPSNMGENGRPGASLYGWSEFFPKSNIYGADIDKDILFNTDRIKTYYCDQTNKETIEYMWNSNVELLENFDIIIEDGLHTFESSVCFFENSIHKLNLNGYYIIEDINNNNIPLFNEKIINWKIRFPKLLFKIVILENKTNNFDNNLLVVYKNE